MNKERVDNPPNANDWVKNIRTLRRDLFFLTGILPEGVERGDLPKEKILGIIGEVTYPEDFQDRVDDLVFTFPVIEGFGSKRALTYNVTYFKENAQEAISRFRRGEFYTGQEVIAGGWLKEERTTSETGETTINKLELYPIALVPIPEDPPFRSSINE
ncbi:hypothetical protein HYS91_00370 [Candidatus Daviesbacteria bacterium]|nr:hypothetical protein [Candidatus Daviesbacteria bacterium]